MKDPLPVPDAAEADDLLDAVQAAGEDRVLVVGPAMLGLLCASARRGCRAATGARSAPLHPEPAEVVLAPHVSDPAEAAGIAIAARRALRAGARDGRLAMRLAGRGAVASGRAVARQLRALGYAQIRILRGAGGSLLVTGHCAPVSAPARAA